MTWDYGSRNSHRTTWVRCIEFGLRAHAVTNAKLDDVAILQIEARDLSPLRIRTRHDATEHGITRQEHRLSVRRLQADRHLIEPTAVLILVDLLLLVRQEHCDQPWALVGLRRATAKYD